ncbi:MAG: PAS domain S-box protein [Alphaproteobacteria bacterium]
MTDKFTLPEAIEAHAYLASIIASSDDAIVSKDLNGNITSWNPAAERIFGYKSEEIVGKHVSILIPAENMAEEDYILGKIRKGERVDYFETLRRRKDGSFVNLSVTVSPIRNSEEKVIGASKIARDISLSKEADRISAHLAAIIESSDDAIMSKDLNGFITSWNKSAERIFGYKAEEVIGRHIMLIIPAERLPEDDKILTTLNASDRLDTWRRHKDGHLVPVSLTVSPIRDRAGNIIGASKVSRDISDRIAAEKALKEISTKKDEFLANMSHELRTPMNAVIGLTGLLKRMDDLPERAQKYIETLGSSASNMMDLINDLLDFAKIETGSFAVENIEFNLPEQVEKVISVANVKAREKKIDLYINYTSDLNRYYIGDPLRIHQVLSNLVFNAIKFTDEGSVKIDISGKAGEAENTTLLSISVSDTGIGIPNDKTHAIFEKFTQADSSITRRFGGSGLGLSIVKSCVELMKGTIAVDSEVGVGTIFTATLPLTNTEKVSTVKSFSASIAPAIPAHKKNILLAEDYEPNVMVAGAFIDDLGYDYDVASNGYEALRKFTTGCYDVILMDIQMNELDGLEATRRIRKMEKDKGLARTPIIAMTAHVREQDKNQALKAGMDDFISKPFESASFGQKINRYMGDKNVTHLETARRAKKD